MDNFYTQCVWFYTQYVKLDTVNSVSYTMVGFKSVIFMCQLWTIFLLFR